MMTLPQRFQKSWYGEGKLSSKSTGCANFAQMISKRSLNWYLLCLSADNVVVKHNLPPRRTDAVPA